MGKVILTAAIAMPGMKVCKGPDWIYGNQDTMNGRNGVGTVKRISTANGTQVVVEWEAGGSEYYYRIGMDFKHDLYLCDECATTRHWSPDEKAALEVGDTVKCINDTDRESQKMGVKVGDIILVKRVSQIPKIATYFLGRKGELDSWLPFSHFIPHGKAKQETFSERRLWTSEEKMTLKVGDYVECIYTNETWVQDLGIGKGQMGIVEVMSEGPSSSLNFKCRYGSKSFWVPYSCFQPPTKYSTSTKPPPPVEQSKPIPFKVGDRVKYVVTHYAGESDKIILGDVVKVTSTSGEEFRREGGLYWLPQSKFTLHQRKNAISTQFINQPIKTGDTYERAIQVQRPVATIQRAARSSGSRIPSGRGKATIGNGHS